jgi:hypothetical protein
VETVTGVVTGVSPLEIQTEQKLVLPEEVLVLTSRVKDKTLVIRKGLKEGEEVIMQRIQGGQQYVVLDRIKNDVVDMELSYDL